MTVFPRKNCNINSGGGSSQNDIAGGSGEPSGATSLLVRCFDIDGAANRTTRSGTCFPLKVETRCISRKKKPRLLSLCTLQPCVGREQKSKAAARLLGAEGLGGRRSGAKLYDMNVQRGDAGESLARFQAELNTNTDTRPLSISPLLCTFCCRTLEKGDGSATFLLKKQKKRSNI